MAADQRRASNGSSNGRVPPHDVSAEQSLLGCALLSTATVLPDAAAFYKPAHQHIAHACQTLGAHGQPVDAVTLADELRRNGLLDDIGGREYLNELVNATPAISNWSRYAEIVTRTWTLRSLIGVSADATELAYSEPDDVAGALATAAGSFADLAKGVGPGRSTLDIADIRALLATDLEPEQPLLLKRSDGGHLLYAGKMHSFIAEPSAGKSWFALQIVVEILAEGGSAIYLDYEDSPRGIVTRLLILGADPAAVAQRFRHVRPDGPLGPAEKAELAAMMADLNPDLVVVDAWIGALNREGLSEDQADDIQKWKEKVAEWIVAESGAALLILDHVSKDPEQRGRYARGSGHKLAMLDGAAFQLKVIKGFSRLRAGIVNFIVAKDRPGGVGAIGEIVASCPVEPHGNGAVLRITVNPHMGGLAADEEFKPTVIMGRVAKLLDEQPDGLTATAIKALMGGTKPGLVQTAIARLTLEGFVVESKAGRGRSKVLRLVKAYAGFTGRPEPTEAHLFDDGQYASAVDEPDYLSAERGAAFETYQDHQ